jgi:hypothetical protein
MMWSILPWGNPWVLAGTIGGCQGGLLRPGFWGGFCAGGGAWFCGGCGGCGGNVAPGAGGRQCFGMRKIRPVESTRKRSPGR